MTYIFIFLAILGIIVIYSVSSSLSDIRNILEDIYRKIEEDDGDYLDEFRINDDR